MISCVFGLFALLKPAHGAVLTFEFSGGVTQVPLDDIFGDIAVGGLIRGTYSFDPSAVDQAPADPSTGSFTWSAPFGMSVAIGAHHFNTSGLLSIGIFNSFVDQYTVLAVSGTGDVALELFLQDNTGSIFSNDRLPGTAPPLGSFGLRDFHLQASFAGGEIQVDGQLDALAARTVPEAPPIILVAAGSILLVLARRKRRLSFR
jgi:hypothetical protein